MREREREGERGIPDFSIAKVNVCLNLCEVVGQTCYQQHEGKACVLERSRSMAPQSQNADLFLEWNLHKPLVNFA